MSDLPRALRTGPRATDSKTESAKESLHYPRIRRMAVLDLSDAEIATAATACRAMAYQESERAKKLENPTLRGPLESNARRYAALAEKLEAARKRA